MKLYTSMLAGASVLALAGAATAADLIIAEDPVVAVAANDWSGIYIGVHGGFGAGVITLESDVIDPSDLEQDVDGFFGGVQLGYNIQTDTLVFGIQTDLSLSGIQYEEDGDGENDTIDWFGTTTARLGVALDGVLPYVKAGIAYGGGTGHAMDEEDTQTAFGWTAGVGVEVALADNISAFAEYNYIDLGQVTYEFSLPVGDVGADADLHTIKAGLNFSF
ncbi:porin family protein [Devosia sp. ZB163]|uniref:outer membrane protein n=1 Tax=Devosia sp. ZB163 TaxID=3025938 RepID=UPI00235E4C32|nr:outer membrane protein [Devosia sp. ZB163]MDC9824125.1 porin family protein [Devosia sp. ZB163]